MKHLASTQSKARRATILAPAVIFLALVGLGFAALAVDTGVMFAARSECQSAADASCLAGASGLGQGRVTVEFRCNEYAGYNHVSRRAVQTGDLDIALGHWNGVLREFLSTDGSGTVSHNAVHVDVTRSNLALVFAKFLGVSETRLKRGATALGGGGVCAGIWGIHGVGGNGSIVTDSYDSTVGSYGTDNINANGDICSCEEIRLVGSLEIHGDVMYGDGYDLTLNGGALDIWGTTGETACDEPTFDIDMEGAQAENDNDTIGLTDNGFDPFNGGGYNLRLSGNDNLTLQPGKYYFDSVRMTGQATLTITGPTEIYVAGDGVFTGGGITNVTEDPHSLTIYSTGGTLDIRGGAGFYGAIVAPDSDVTLVGNTGFFGTVLAGTVDLTGTTDIHIDESLVRDIFGIEPFTPLLVE